MASVTNVLVQEIFYTPGFVLGVDIHWSKTGCN